MCLLESTLNVFYSKICNHPNHKIYLPVIVNLIIVILGIVWKN